MKDLQNIAKKITDTQAVITRLKDEIAQMDAVPPSVESTLLMLHRRHEELEQDYKVAAANRHLEICEYKLFNPESPTDQPKLKTFASALIGLQNVFSLVYDALSNEKPKAQSKLSAEAYLNTSFDVAYSTHNSLGLVLTLPAEAMVPLFGQTTIDEAMETVFKLLSAKDPEDIAVYAKKLGQAPIRKLYEWVSAQAASGMSARLEWNDQAANFAETFEYSEFEHLKAIIESSSDETVEQMEIVGLLVGLDVTSRTFHMTFEEIAEMKGKIDDPIGKFDATVELPRRYKAWILTTTKTSYATERETVQYFLKGLERLD
jgi:hypothetical protein